MTETLTVILILYYVIVATEQFLLWVDVGDFDKKYCVLLALAWPVMMPFNIICNVFCDDD